MKNDSLMPGAIIEPMLVQTYAMISCHKATMN